MLQCVINEQIVITFGNGEPHQKLSCQSDFGLYQSRIISGLHADQIKLYELYPKKSLHKS